MEKPKIKIRKFDHIILDWSQTFDEKKVENLAAASKNNSDVQNLNEDPIYKLQICDQVKEWKTIYWGSKTQYKVEKLGACTCYNFRIKREKTDSEWIFFKGATEDIGPFNSVMHMTRAVKLGKTAVIRKIAAIKPHLLNAENKDNKTPIVQSIDNNDMQILHLLINLGANVNQTLRFSKRTPLMIAVYQGKLHMATLLIDKGADTSIKDVNELTILHYAVDSNKVENVEFVLQHNVDVNAQDNFGWTSLLRAGCSQRITQILFDHGANADLMDKFGFDFEKHIQINSTIK